MKTKQKKNKKALWIIIGVIVALGIIGSFGEDEPTTDTTETAIVEQGETVEQEEQAEPSEDASEAEKIENESSEPEPEETPAPEEEKTAEEPKEEKPAITPAAQKPGLSDIPAYNGKAFAEINNNQPFFTFADRTTDSFEKYSPLDNLGRCGVAFANIGTDIMPTEERGSIGMVKPSGWQTIKYENVEGKYLYNRCHLKIWLQTMLKKQAITFFIE